MVAAGRLGHFAGNKPVISSNFDQLILYAVQYGRAFGAQVLGIDGGSERGDFAKSIDAQVYIDVSATSNIIEHIRKITNGGAHAVVVAVGNPKAYAQTAEMLRIGGTLSCVGRDSTWKGFY